MALQPASTAAGVRPLRLPPQRREVALPYRRVRAKSVWLKAERRYPRSPHETRRFRDLYAGCVSVEWEFGRLKHEYGLSPLRVRGLERVALYADLTMLARLAQALSRARAVPLAA